MPFSSDAENPNLDVSGITGKHKKPPIGIMPKYIHDAKRKEELRQAIYRYISECMCVPVEWVEEYNMLIKSGK